MLTESWKVKVKGAVLQYSGADQRVEVINSTYMLAEPVNVFVRLWSGGGGGGEGERERERERETDRHTHTHTHARTHTRTQT